ncbi:HNH endonuclease [Janibacter anophelis]|uniref:HNH endonuclease n=1 Tax=Janibacter anophelis TaxID=319054 RepID=UPI003F80358E
MVAKLPTGEQANIEDDLWDKSGGLCFLCEEPLNRASDAIEADHDVPESEGGPTTLENLNLAHESCNRAKRSAKSVPIRPYLKLVAYTKKYGGRLKYDGYTDHFGIEPKPVVATRDGDTIKFELPDGSFSASPILSEANSSGTFEYTFLSLPRSAIFNDDACQPRALRPEHAWSIYSDLQKNVLHEPPSCRMETYVLDQPVKLLMFDGQHKTVANWMMGRQVVTAKVYLNLSAANAIQLVNSIQAKIKKLPLSPFELAGKMSDELENKFHEYEEEVGSVEVSESGFLAWLGSDKARGKQALQSALVQSILSNPNLRIMNHIRQPGAPAPKVSITEQQLKGKVLEKLLHKDALSLKGEDAQAARDREADNIVSCLNQLTDEAFEPTDEATELTEQELERARRMTYQASLAYVSGMIRSLWKHVVMSGDIKAPMSEDLSEAQEKQIRDGIKNIVSHPCWTADFDRDDKMRKLKVALEKNQEVQQALEALGLDLAYLILGKEAPSFKAHWHAG